MRTYVFLFRFLSSTLSSAHVDIRALRSISASPTLPDTQEPSAPSFIRSLTRKFIRARRMLHLPEKSAAVLRSKFRTTFARRVFRLGSAAATAIAAPILCTISSQHPLRGRFLGFSRCRRRRRQRTAPSPDMPERLAVISFPENFRLGNPGSRHPDPSGVTDGRLGRLYRTVKIRKRIRASALRWRASRD